MEIARRGSNAVNKTLIPINWDAFPGSQGAGGTPDPTLGVGRRPDPGRGRDGPASREIEDRIWEIGGFVNVKVNVNDGNGGSGRGFGEGNQYRKGLEAGWPEAGS